MPAETATATTYALETRAEKLKLYTPDLMVRDGETDRVEVGRSAYRDVVEGSESVRVGRDLREVFGESQMVRARRLETTVEGRMVVHGHSNTTMLGGAMTESHNGGVFVAAGMSDDLVAGGGMRVSAPADIWVAGLIGMEEKLVTAMADGLLLEMYGTHFEREYATGQHAAGVAMFSGTICTTTATGFWQLSKIVTNVRNLTPGGGGGGAEGPPAAPPPVPAGSGGLLGAASGAGAAAGATQGLSSVADAARGTNLNAVFDQVSVANHASDTAEQLGDMRKLSGVADGVLEGGDQSTNLEKLTELAGRTDALDSMRRGIDAVDPDAEENLLEAAELFVKARNGDTDARSALMRMAGSGDPNARKYVQGMMGYGDENRRVMMLRILAEGEGSTAAESVEQLRRMASGDGAEAEDARAALARLDAAGKLPADDPAALRRSAITGNTDSLDTLKRMADGGDPQAAAEYQKVLAYQSALARADESGSVEELDRLVAQRMVDRRESNWNSYLLLRQTEEETLKPFVEGFSEAAGTAPGASAADVRAGLVTQIRDAQDLGEVERVGELGRTLGLFDSGLREIAETSLAQAEELREVPDLPADFNKQAVMRALDKERVKLAQNTEYTMEQRRQVVSLGLANADDYPAGDIDLMYRRQDMDHFYDTAMDDIFQGRDPRGFLEGETALVRWESTRVDVPHSRGSPEETARQIASYEEARKNILRIMSKHGGWTDFRCRRRARF